MADTLKSSTNWPVGAKVRRALSMFLMLAGLLLGTASAIAQSGPSDETNRNGRKVVVRVKPDYSVLLRGSNIGGTVRLTATVLPNGNVTKVSILGGNPILAESAVKAVLQWKFAPGPIQTSEAIQLNFH